MRKKKQDNTGERKRKQLREKRRAEQTSKGNKPAEKESGFE